MKKEEARDYLLEAMEVALDSIEGEPEENDVDLSLPTWWQKVKSIVEEEVSSEDDDEEGEE